MAPYKKEIVATDVPQLKPFDYSRQLDSIAEDMNRLSNKTAEMAKANFINTFDMESRKALADAYDRNMNNPAQLEKEQAKIQQKYVSALPTKELRDSAKLRFNIHAMGYLGKAKENLYNQEYRQLQASTLDRTNVILNDIQENGKDLLNSNLGVSGAAANSIGSDLITLNEMLSSTDARGNMVVSPERQAALKDEVRKRLTASDLDHFNGLGTMKEKEAFYKQYKDKATKKIWLDPEDKRGYSEQGMTENNTDWPTYERNLAAMEKTFEAAKQAAEKGMSDLEQNQFAIIKIKEALRLDVMQEGLAEDEKVNPYKVLAFLQQVNDLTTKAEHAYKMRDGRIAYYLEPSEAYKYKSDVLKKYWTDTLATFEKQNDNTNFSYGLKQINLFFEKNKDFHGLNEFDRMDIMQEYYRQLSAVMSPENMQSAARFGLYSTIDEAARQAIQNTVMRDKKFSQYAKNMILTTPKEIKATYITEQSPLPGNILPNIKY